MRDLVNEILIIYHNWRMINSTCLIIKKHHINNMMLRIKSRSLKQIKRMEFRRGL